MTDTHLSHDGEAHGTVGGYVAGFILSVLLTAASFGLVLSGALSSHASLIALAALAFVQIVVHLVYFLHMNASSGQRWNVMAFSYTVLTAAILIVGTLWVMHNVGMNMMSR
ncbi:cytochrome o ubiquinol oxidase subunit IV [Burkholderia sp. ABCPW 14]|uniref:Cytochrome bo(3) ubiquinol oxidase subunit 4 n=2 Tax=pseudomallei group TaxID=111527 RepID=A0A1B4FRE1_9BURK|nr:MULTISPECIES: cytochrome o ubiquinol oxidase subunit IV [Burkholderia]AIO68896.1 cytochrome o ubiquinol oxidase subunit IV [Burkholderia oklahomensis]AJX34430.1 cytochrome o ubiquinol oxidase subunit IV [Burkholderia oklahomensis C6786]AOI38523.1 cytochrome o ubiquinol oxidase subunit IV [Burkholderia oklahomensis EO147]AOI48240.1 cytochrome o ubiquinol oxidase subunit IV [Burkholderia oklahomensis C6786]AOJ06234.1 cytochrome o ubiquinol oxidase subunit IV [Burkholderia mayonis]